jgi:hypothetical protein
MLHRVAPTLTRNSAQRLCKCRRFDCPINVCSEQSAYGNGAGVVAVAFRSSVVSDVGLRLSSGVGVGVAPDFGLALCAAPWLAPCAAPVPFECRAREGCMGNGARHPTASPSLRGFMPSLVYGLALLDCGKFFNGLFRLLRIALYAFWSSEPKLGEYRTQRLVLVF